MEYCFEGRKKYFKFSMKKCHIIRTNVKKACYNGLVCVKQVVMFINSGINEQL